MYYSLFVTPRGNTAAAVFHSQQAWTVLLMPNVLTSILSQTKEPKWVQLSTFNQTRKAVTVKTQYFLAFS